MLDLNPCGDWIPEVEGQEDETFKVEFIQGEGWQIVKSNQCYDWGIPTKEEAKKELINILNSSPYDSVNCEGALI